MSQQNINLGTLLDGSDGDTRRVAMQKIQANTTELYGLAGGAQSRRNLLLNGDGRVNQRGFAGGILAANTYGYDMWRTLGAASSITFAQATASLNGTVCQVIEAPALQNATVTISVSNPSAPITVKLQPDATTATTATGAIPAGAGRQSVTLAVPATLTGNVFVLLSTAGATTFDSFGARSGIQLELGSFANTFDYPFVASEQILCQRYAYVWRSMVTGTQQVFGIGQVFSSGLIGRVRHPYPVVMRGNPAITVTGAWTAQSGGTQVSASLSSQYANPYAFEADILATGFTPASAAVLLLANGGAFTANAGL
jgi:hypothetical protein